MAGTAHPDLPRTTRSGRALERKKTTTKKRKIGKRRAIQGTGRVLGSKTSLMVVLAELEAQRNVSQVVMEKSLPYFLQTDEESISGDRLTQTWYSLLCRMLKIQQMSQE